MPETVSGVNWRLNIDQVRITSTTIKLPVIFTAVNFEAQRYFTYDHTGDTELGINKMADFIGYCYGKLLAEDELKLSTLL